MIAVMLSLVVVFVLLVSGEFLWRTNRLRGEAGRKFIHISVGTFIAFWPFYMSFQTVQLLSLALLIVVLCSRRLHIFQAVHTIDRRSLGDVLFAIGIGLTATLTMSKWIFAAAVLHLSLADGLAAIIGKRYGKNNQYSVLGATKSVIGTATFAILSIGILSFVLHQTYVSSSTFWPVIICLPAAAAIFENFSIMGLDNVLVPLLVVVVLSSLKFSL